MKAVILAGGLGTRMREETEYRPKPMVLIGGEPLLWHIMRVFARFGHADFIICAGYKQEIIRDYFQQSVWEEKSQDLVKSFPPEGAPEPTWNIEIIDTGLTTETGGRLKKIQHLVEEEEFFLTYGDSLANVDLTRLVETHRKMGLDATVTLANPTSRFGVVELDRSGIVLGFNEKPILSELVSIGFFVFGPQIFSYLADNSVLEGTPLARISKEKRMAGFKHEGFWQPIDTYRELLAMQKIWNRNGEKWN